MQRTDAQPAPKLLDRGRQALRTRHYSRRAEEAYVGWIRRFVLFHGRRHPAEMGEPEVARFLSSLAVEARVSASTQSQALSALLFLYRHVLDQSVGWIDGVARAKRPKRLPVVLTREEVRVVLNHLEGVTRIMGLLLYMGPGSACSSAFSCGSRTSTSAPTRSSCAAARATRTA